MSSGKWETVNGVRYPVEGSESGDYREESFTYDGKVWDFVRDLTEEEAKTISGAGKTDWSEFTDEGLMCHTFGAGASRMKGPYTEPIVVNLNEETTTLPFGQVNNGALLELVWRMTGADCAGEEADLVLPTGTYHIVLTE